LGVRLTASFTLAMPLMRYRLNTWVKLKLRCSKLAPTDVVAEKAPLAGLKVWIRLPSTFIWLTNTLVSTTVPGNWSSGSNWSVAGAKTNPRWAYQSIPPLPATLRVWVEVLTGV
jgi:hypothetical protein